MWKFSQIWGTLFMFNSACDINVQAHFFETNNLNFIYGFIQKRLSYFDQP